MPQKNKTPDNQITVYQTRDGKVNIEVLYSDEKIWLPQKKIAELFEVHRSVVTKHLRNIFASNELQETSVCAHFAHTAEDGKDYQTKFYSLEAIIAVGYRVNSERGTQFRQWAITILQKYIYKGFAVDGDRFKYGSRFSSRYFDELLEEIRDIRSSERMLYQKITDIYATAIDYSSTAEATKSFFATVQNKLHFAITGKTAAEIVSQRADSSKPNMGLTSWRKSPHGKIYPSDVSVAKNYLNKEELDFLNRIVTMYLDYADMQAVRNRAMYMKDWAEKLNAFLKFSEYEILTGAGKISHEVAMTLAAKEYEKFKKIQDESYISDFDREIKRIAGNKDVKR
jgi:hypothetical protein